MVKKERLDPRSLVRSLEGLRCWYVSWGGAVGSTFQLAFGEKIARSAVLKNPAHTEEYQRYEGVMAWHPEKKSLYQVSFAFDGSVNEVLIEIKDKDTLHVGCVPFAEGKPSLVRQVLRFLDNDRFQWTVSVRDGDGWKQVIDATWTRKSK